MKKSNGFTLIELIIVIVILGILAVVAAPRFIDVSKDATVASLNGMQGAVKSAVELTYGKALVKRATTGAQTLELDANVSIPVHSGYPTAHWNNALRYVIALDNIEFSNANTICQSDWCGRGNQPSANTDASLTVTGNIAKVWPRGYRWEDRCSVHYVNNEDGTKPIIGISTSEC